MQFGVLRLLYVCLQLLSVYNFIFVTYHRDLRDSDECNSRGVKQHQGRGDGSNPSLCSVS